MEQLMITYGIKYIQRRPGSDVKLENLRPVNGEGCVGRKNGIDGRLSLEQVIELASKMVEKPNIIIKGGKKAQWYIKQCPVDEIEGEKYGEWKDVSRCTMYIIDW